MMGSQLIDQKEFWDEVARIREACPYLSEEAYEMIAYETLTRDNI